jgi:hypothetical protein
MLVDLAAEVHFDRHRHRFPSQPLSCALALSIAIAASARRVAAETTPTYTRTGFSESGESG